MKTLQINTLSAALGLIIATTAIHAAEHPGYLMIKETEVEVESKRGNKTLDLKINTQAPIPVEGNKISAKK